MRLNYFNFFDSIISGINDMLNNVIDSSTFRKEFKDEFKMSYSYIGDDIDRHAIIAKNLSEILRLEERYVNILGEFSHPNVEFTFNGETVEFIWDDTLRRYTNRDELGFLWAFDPESKELVSIETIECEDVPANVLESKEPATDEESAASSEGDEVEPCCEECVSAADEPTLASRVFTDLNKNIQNMEPVPRGWEFARTIAKAVEAGNYSPVYDGSVYGSIVVMLYDVDIRPDAAKGIVEGKIDFDACKDLLVREYGFKNVSFFDFPNSYASIKLDIA